jgi:hypothetical protein
MFLFFLCESWFLLSSSCGCCVYASSGGSGIPERPHPAKTCRHIVLAKSNHTWFWNTEDNDIVNPGLFCSSLIYEILRQTPTRYDILRYAATSSDTLRHPRTSYDIRPTCPDNFRRSSEKKLQPVRVPQRTTQQRIDRSSDSAPLLRTLPLSSGPLRRPDPSLPSRNVDQTCIDGSGYRPPFVVETCAGQFVPRRTKTFP